MTEERAAQEALESILAYIGGLDQYKNNAQLISYIEWAIRVAVSFPPTEPLNSLLSGIEREENMKERVK